MKKGKSNSVTALWILALSVVGFQLWGAAGVLVGAFFGWLIGSGRDGRDEALAERVQHLEERLADLEQRLAGPPLEPVAPAEAERAETAAAPPAVPAEEAPAAGPVPAPEPRHESPLEEASTPVSSAPSAIQRVTGFFAGGNPVVRIGILVLFFGVAFLARYAAERGWVSIELRLAAIAAAGIGVFFIGWRLRERPGAYGLVLQGGAVGILYLTVFAAARLYGLVPMGLAFGIMLALVLFSGVLALLQDARWLALFGVTGGFLAPVLLSTGGGSHIALFSYYALLNAGILGIAWFRAWRELNLAGFFFTFVVGALWGYRYYRPEHFATTEPFLILFFAFYVAIAVLFALRQPPRLKGYVDGSLVFGVPVTGFALQAALTHDMEYGLAYSAVAVSAFYVVLAWSLWRRAGEGLRLLAEAFLALAIVFTTLAVPLALEGQWTAAVWAVEGAALVWVGVRQRRVLPRISGVVLQLGAGLAFLESGIDAPADLPLWNGRWLGSVTVASAGLFTAWYLHHSATRLQSFEKYLRLPLLTWSLAWWLGAGLLEIEAHVPGREQSHALGLFFALSTAVAAVGGHRLRWRQLAMFATALMPVLAVLLVAEWAVQGRPHALDGWGLLSWPLAIAASFLVLRQSENTWPERLTYIWHAAGLWLLTALLTWELDWLINDQIRAAATWHTVAWAVFPATAVLGLLRWGTHLGWPLSRHDDAYRVLGLGALAGYLFLWSLAAGLRPGDAAPLPYVPVLNPLDLAQLFALLAAVRWLLWWRARHPERAARLLPLPLLPAFGVAGFFWLNVVLARAVHFWANVDWRWEALMSSVTWQSAASLLWALTALVLMVAATRRGWRLFWFTGAGLLAVVVAKLFVVDLSGIGTLGRIVSFLGVGGLMLVIGFFSPLPPRQPGEKEEQMP